MDDALPTVNAIREIAAGGDATATGASAQGLELLRHYGLVGFNQVAARPGAHTELTIAGEPLLVTGAYGSGKTAAFTGLTSPASEQSEMPIDEYLIADPRERAYFVLFADMLADVLPGEQKRAANLLVVHETPLFQTLKEQPRTELAVTKVESAPGADSPAHCLVRIVNTGGYAHLVHMRVEWPEAGPKPFLTEMSDNDFELLPNETREIELSWRSGSASPQAAGTLIVNAANAPEARLAF
jgi:hypothetical protein